MGTPKNQASTWHASGIQEVLSELKTDANTGLSPHDAQLRLQQHGPNILSSKKESWLKRIIEPFTSLFVIVMLIAVVISLLTHEPFDAAIIGCVLILNAAIYYFQQYSVSKVLASLKAHEDGNVTVKRSGQTLQISVRDIVPGDIVYVFEGLKIPADGRLVENNGLHIDESILTGESLPVTKSTETLSKTAEIYDQTNMVFKGTLAHSGSGQMVVCATGNNTQLGAISTLASSSDIGRTPIEKKIDDITRKIISGVAIVGTVVFGLAILRGIAVSEAIRFTLSLVVSVVPEGLPVTLTVVLLLSAKRMAAHKALVKKLSAIETMGAVTLIATDKTGTLTKNKLEIASAFPGLIDVEEAAAAGITKQNGLAFDPLDELLEKSFKVRAGFGKKVADLPFDQQKRMSGAIWKVADGYHVQLKGAPEALIAKESKAIAAKLYEYTSKGYRTIALGHIKTKKPIASLSEIVNRDIHFDGLIGLADPLRKQVPAAIAEAKAAGIKVVMLTGDHKTTAAEIAKQAGLIVSNDEVAESKILEKPPNPKLMQTLLTRVHVFGRVLPKHKFNFLKSIKKTEVTAMTGDGVNDIPALVEADAGLAMGSGTDAAKDASDIVLLNDNFATIIDAVRLGRAVVANIRKMLFYLISTSLGEASTMIGALLFGLPLPITAVQILWVNLVTDSFTVMPIGLSKPEHHQMKQPPHQPSAPLLSRVMMSRTIFTGVLTASATLFVFWKLLPAGYAYAQTAAFTALVVAQWTNALNANFDRHSWTYIFVKPNFLLLGGIIVSMALQAVVMFGPLASAFGIVTLAPSDLLLAIAVPTLTVLLGVDLHKLLFREKATPAQ